MKYRPRLEPLPPKGGEPYRPGLPPRRREDVVDTLARTLWGEARDRSLPALEALACAVRNRADAGRSGNGGRWRGGIGAACLQPGEFAAWRPDPAGRRPAVEVTEADPFFVLCRRVAREAVAGTVRDPTGGATLFHPAGAPPAWAEGHEPTAVVGGLCFYRETAGTPEPAGNGERPGARARPPAARAGAARRG
jgi:hypothetical protein